MRLSTTIIDPNNNPVAYSIKESSVNTLYGPRMDVYICVGGSNIGFMQYSFEEHCLYIHRMDNFTLKQQIPLKYVGTALFEYALNKSLKAGKGGRIELTSIGDSPVAYYKMGLRRKSYGAYWLNDLIVAYCLANSEAEASQIADKIYISDYYQSLRETAAKNLAKNTYEVSVQEALKYGICSHDNAVFEAELKMKGQLSSSDCYRLYMQGIMFLPPEMIAAKRKQFSQFKPIGGNFIFSKKYAENGLKNPTLKELVKSGKLDPSNAVEIDNKISTTDPRLAVLLSPIGLRMMKRNYVSGWYICVYFHELRCVQALLSENGLKLFEHGYIKHVNQLIHLGYEVLSLILSNAGLEKLEKGEIKISESGCIHNKDGNPIVYLKLVELFQNQINSLDKKYIATSKLKLTF